MVFTADLHLGYCTEQFVQNYHIRLNPEHDLSSRFITLSGTVYYIGENGKLTKCFAADGAIYKLMIVETKNILVTITQNMMLAQHNISPTGDLKEVIKVRPSNGALPFYYKFTTTLGHSRLRHMRMFVVVVPMTRDLAKFK